MLESDDVLRKAVEQGVREGIFGLLVGEKVYYEETFPINEITEDIFILRKELAIKKTEAEETKALPISEEKQRALTEEVIVQKEIPTEVGVVKRSYTLRTKVPTDKISDFVRGVIVPLTRECEEVELEIKVEASSSKGINENTINSKVKETLRQIGAEIIEEDFE